MNRLNANAFTEISLQDTKDIDGGIVILGVTISGVLLLKVFGAGVTLGATAAGIYYSQK